MPHTEHVRDDGMCAQHGVRPDVCSHLIHGGTLPDDLGPTLGELADTMRAWKADGVTGESAYYAATKVWDDLAPVTLSATESRSPRSQLLHDADTAISGDRQRDYGPVLPGFERIAALWSIILGTEVTAEQYAMCQIATKVGRLVETPNHRDSWLDVAGYAALGAEVAATDGRYV
ncbi:hypothetical protein SEA_FUNSIZED_58 [Mycobacterium phage Funsized]|nr:hypothetical protein SEA_FUNSIZED_58 [Mycobacterium phage Funsized]